MRWLEYFASHFNFMWYNTYHLIGSVATCRSFFLECHISMDWCDGLFHVDMEDMCVEAAAMSWYVSIVTTACHCRNHSRNHIFAKYKILSNPYISFSSASEMQNLFTKYAKEYQCLYPCCDIAHANNIVLACLFTWLHGLSMQPSQLFHMTAYRWPVFAIHVSHAFFSTNQYTWAESRPMLSTSDGQNQNQFWFESI